MTHSQKLSIRLLALLLILSGCAASNQHKQLSTDAAQALATGDYQKTLTNYESIIALNSANHKETEGSVYNNAGIAAWELQQTEKSIDYLETAKKLSASTGETLATLAKAYRQTDNLSKEILNLQEYVELHPQGRAAETVRAQLFSAYVRSENWEQGRQLWPLLDSTSRGSLHHLTGYLRILRKLEKASERDSVAQKILAMDKNSIEALETMAEKHYYAADETYVREMKAYERNKTMRQYNQVTAAIKRVNQDYRAARDYFERLYKLNPSPRYANFLGNIYTRFENKEKAGYYYRLARKK